ncbi:OLC1v1032700C2 [Oldenlandia corymbosa var. corymbosa]|uniref:OLC1v1032700C2 n=1 Tax=Oldenlandia corymbosa var. corymbosa TaxID=529605 RepID=A0AAV1CLF1_OLDCO|nr:OLC1v1032700C2 [Oldenlandia corymbosa var. corymbosa]
METSSGLSPRLSSIAANKGKNEDPDFANFELEQEQHVSGSDHHFRSTNALEILRETVRILRFNSTGFMAILAFLICPVSAVVLSNVLVNHSIVRMLYIKFLLVAKSSGLPLRPFVKHSCQKFSEIIISAIVCFPLYITLSLLSKAAVVYSVDCTYAKKRFDSSKFYIIVRKIWRRIVVTYMWVCGVIVGCITLFFVLLFIVSNSFLVMGFPSDLILYPAMVAGLIFSIILANSIIVCNIAIVISVLEDVSGRQALLRSSSLVKGQTEVGLLIFLLSTIGMAMVEGLFEHRVKTISYGDGSSRVWEGPLLVLMYSFVVLIDSMMSAVFYFSCKSFSAEASALESQPVLEALTISLESTVLAYLSVELLKVTRTGEDFRPYAKELYSFSTSWEQLHITVQMSFIFLAILDGIKMRPAFMFALITCFPKTGVQSLYWYLGSSQLLVFCYLNSHSVPIYPVASRYKDISRFLFLASSFIILTAVTPAPVCSTSSTSEPSSREYFCFRLEMNRQRHEKILKFEEFIDGRLKPDLVRAIAERDKVFERQKIFSDLKKNIENLEKYNVTSLKTMVNLGSEVYMQADVPDTRHVFVDVGLGFHVEFTWSEALTYIAAKEESLDRQIEEYTRTIATIKAQIKLIKVMCIHGGWKECVPSGTISRNFVAGVTGEGEAPEKQISVLTEQDNTTSEGEQAKRRRTSSAKSEFIPADNFFFLTKDFTKFQLTKISSVPRKVPT